MAEKNCWACAFSGMDPDAEFLVCGHPDSGSFGLYVHHATKEGGHCGPERPKFEQHPHRNADGSLHQYGKDA